MPQQTDTKSKYFFYIFIHLIISAVHFFKGVVFILVLGN